MSSLRACGFVLYRKEKGRNLYLLLESARHGDVGAPKGHVEPDEAELEAALRETLEETGLEAARLSVHAHFRRAIRYPVGGREKEAVYFAACTDAAEVRLSDEHASGRWLDLDAALAALRHEDLRGVFRDAAVFVKDEGLRRGLDPPAARALLEREADGGVVAHSAQVAGMARTLAEAWGGLDTAYVESAAWLHDIGRARTHGPRHPLAGFRLVVDAGHPGYAPPCLSHYTKGVAAEELGLPPDLADEMWSCCDLDTLSTEETLIALADAMAAGERRVTVEERYEDLVRRYGESAFFDRVRAAALGFKASFEARTSSDVYAMLLRA